MSSTRNNLDAAVFRVVKQNGSNPGAGNPFQGAAPLGCISTLALLQFNLNADANAANRVVRIQVGTGSFNPYLATSINYQTANINRYYIAHVNNANVNLLGPSYEPLPLPNSPCFEHGDTVDISVASMQVGDLLTSIRIVWHCWIVGQ